ncbi:MAG: hypothetical protein LJE62_04690 [Silicimonas sp.]|nr:hypothetical protein [Silicimonas sp.]
MTIHAFTSFSFSYLNRARVLSAGLKRLHPDWVLWAVVTDLPPDGMQNDWTEDGYDRVLTAEELFGDQTEPWLFGHDIVEACTAVKGAAARRILGEPECDKLIYFDPDIAVFNPMDEVVDLLDAADIVLTPHQIAPEPRSAHQAIRDNEITSLSHGAYNLGFVAVANRSEGLRFAEWWDDRLRDWCHDRRDIGIFVDQKWCDLVPCFFENVKVHRDPGCNVASWNLSHRDLRFDDAGQIRVNGSALKFYHFTKLGPVGDTMTQRYARDNHEVYEVWSWYRNAVAAATDPAIPEGYWHYKTFDNGTPIPPAARRLYRERKDLRAAFTRPRTVADGFHDWLAAETDLLEA